MKKKFISVALFGAVLIASSSVLSSCKDYDDDISSVQGELHTGLDALTAQYNALNEALETAKSEAKAAQEAATAAINEAQSTADEGVKAAAEAKAKAELAKQAAEEAKAEAIAEAQKLVEEVKKMIPSTDDFVTNETLNTKVQELVNEIAAIDVSNRLAALEEQLGNINLDEVQSAIDQMETQYVAVEKFETLLKENGVATTGDLDEKIADAKASIETEMDNLAKVSEVNSLQARVEAAEKALQTVETSVTVVNQNLVTIVSKGLRSLVFYPNLFINGIEAAEYGFVRNAIMTGTDAQGDDKDNEGNSYEFIKNQTDGRSVDYKVSGDSADINRYVDITYHMNPSTANIKDASDVAFVSRNAEVIGLRSTEEANVGGIIAKSIDAVDGKLNVKIQANGAALEKAAENGLGTIFAAQVNTDDTTIVTSDYALLYPTKIKIEHLAFNNPDYIAEDCNVAGFNDVLFDIPNKAVEFKGGQWTDPEYDNLVHPVQEAFCIPYNDSIDLNDMFQLHYSWNSPTKNATSHAVILPGKEADYGLKYEYNLIDYTIGNNGTSESKYAKLNNGVLKPCIVRANNTTVDIDSSKEEEGRSSIGRHPLVQVLVRDTVNNVVVLDGYVQFEIVDVPKYTMTDVFKTENINYAPCDGASKKIYWYQVSDLLYEYSKMSKEEFEETYEIEEVNGQVKQFVWKGEGTPTQGEIANSFRDITGTAEQIGTILFDRDEDYLDEDNDGTTTNTFTWNFDGCNTVKIYEKPGHTHTVYVRFARVNNKISSDYRYVYLPINVTVNERNKEIGTIGEKIKNYWFSNNRFPEEYAFTRLNVHAPEDYGSTLPFKVSLTQVWNGNAIKISGLENAAQYNAYYTSGPGHKFFFAPFEGTDNKRKGDSGREYTLNVRSNSMISKCPGFGSYNWDSSENDNNNNIINEHAIDPNNGVFTNDVVTATYGGITQEIAKIHHNNGEPYIEFLQTDYAKDLLNGYESQRLDPEDNTKDGAQLFVNIGVVAYDNCIVKAIENNINPAYFIRPIDIVGKSDVFVDATDNGEKAYVFDLFEFNDWREVKFADEPWYYAYYNIKSVEINTTEVETNMNQADTTKYVKLSSVTDKLKISYVGGSSATLSSLHRMYNYQGATGVADAYRDAMGYIYYENNMDNVAEFDLCVPVSFTYDWGTITRKVKIKVKKTMGQN